MFSSFFIYLFIYLFLIKWTSIPKAKIVNPAIEMADPFTVHWGLLYMNEDCGPITELLCATNIVPAIISINPTTTKILTKIDFLIIMKVLLLLDLLLIYYEIIKVIKNIIFQIS
jgi:hypothetical protein